METEKQTPLTFTIDDLIDFLLERRRELGNLEVAFSNSDEGTSSMKVRLAVIEQPDGSPQRVLLFSAMD